mmetsp:Transcript_22333/g.48452  ORF Transcript_22333/g.48452 Transcript_22333/m.48452 type:complete len:95 (+) Transcript_22333:40-324(+)
MKALCSPSVSFSRHRIGSNEKGPSSNQPFSNWDSFDSLTRWSPHYEVIDNAKHFQVKLDVPEFRRRKKLETSLTSHCTGRHLFSRISNARECIR